MTAKTPSDEIVVGPDIMMVAVQPQFNSDFSALIRGHRPDDKNPGAAAAPRGSLLRAQLGASKGFYLRRINGVLWLRGYRSGPEHIYSPEDRLVFCRLQN
jgi:hypothetical protein